MCLVFTWFWFCFFVLISHSVNWLQQRLKGWQNYLLLCTSAFAMDRADCARILFSPHSFFLGMKRKIVPDCSNVNDTLLVLMALLQISISKALKTKVMPKRPASVSLPCVVTLAGLMQGSSCLSPTTGRNCWGMRARLSRRAAWIEGGNVCLYLKNLLPQTISHPTAVFLVFIKKKVWQRSQQSIFSNCNCSIHIDIDIYTENLCF